MSQCHVCRAGFDSPALIAHMMEVMCGSMRYFKRWLVLASLACFGSIAWAAGIPGEARQLIVSTAESWDSSRGQLQRYARVGGQWQPVGAPIQVLFGKNGLAWGVGVSGQEQHGRQKVEGDQRAPAGVFALGRAFGDAPALPFRSNYPYHQVTAADAWIENSNHPQYNQHVRVDVKNPPPWFKKEQMRQNDAAHKWKLEIKHNAAPAIPGRGSAIFFHIQRGPNKTSAGCTTMPEADLLSIMQWLDYDAHPHYVLLPQADYHRLALAWALPAL